ncbi:MAG TPA: hypothetical protein VHD36_20130 [Pirellulales bacterium]|nr:hypothetical protein [Pirellulales bacterium]
MATKKNCAIWLQCLAFAIMGWQSVLASAGQLQKPRDDEVAAKQPPKKFVKRSNFTHPMPVKGRAMNGQGGPVASAKIYVASKLAGWKRIASGETNGAGHYELRDVELPIETANSESEKDRGAFEVFGEADGYGFAWRTKEWFYPQQQQQPKPEATIVLDLVFPPPAALSGRIVDEFGKPLPNTVLTLKYCSTTPPEGYGPNREFRVMSPANELESLNDRDSVPPEIRIRTTDADGRFSFTQLPKDCRFRIAVSPPNFAGRSIWAATRDDLRDDEGNTILNGDIVVEFAHPRVVPIQVLYGDTDKPARRVLVQGDSAGAHWSETSDEEGRVTLRLPPGAYRLQLLPEHGTSYLVSDSDFVVSASDQEPILARLRPAAVVEITVIDADTGVGIPDVDVWREVNVPATPDEPARTYRETPYFRSWEVATRIAHVERPHTDENGKLRMLFEARPQRIGVALHSQPRGYRVVEENGQVILCGAGKTVQVTFHLRKIKPAANAKAR